MYQDITKKDAKDILLSDYTDINRRVTLFHNSFSDPKNGAYDSENQTLWSGEALILLYLNGLMESNDFGNFLQGLNKTYVKNGLYARQPSPFYNTPHHNVSWDEYRGLFFGLAAGKAWKGFLNADLIGHDVITYGKANNWVFWDSEPNLLLVPEKWLSFKKLYLTLSGWRQPRERAFYKIISGQKPNWHELLHFSLSTLLTSFGNKEDTTGKIIAWFSIKSLEAIGYKSTLFSLCAKKFDSNMKKLYNSDSYMEEVFKIYFKDQSHPFHTLIKGL